MRRVYQTRVASSPTSSFGLVHSAKLPWGNFTPGVKLCSVMPGKVSSLYKVSPGPTLSKSHEQVYQKSRLFLCLILDHYSIYSTTASITISRRSTDLVARA